jgi:hypothetical protein
MSIQLINEQQASQREITQRLLSMRSYMVQATLKLEALLVEAQKMEQSSKQSSLHKHRPLPDFLNESKEPQQLELFPDSMVDESGYDLNTQHLTASYKGLVQS